jgi:hypothetical protein
MAKWKSTNGQTPIYKIYTWNKRSSNKNPTDKGGMEKVLGVAGHETCVLYSGYNPPTIFKILFKMGWLFQIKKNSLNHL